MRIIIGICLLLGLLSPLRSYAQHDFGLGIVLGDPTGLTAKYILNNDNAIDAALSFGGHDSFYLHGSWLSLRNNLFNAGKFPVSWYFGLGARIIDHDHAHNHDHDDHEDDMHLGARAPLGLRMNFNDPRIELFGEISFAMDVIPETDFDLDFGIGARYYF